MITVDTQFRIAQMVYLKVAPETRGMVTGILLRDNDHYAYYVTWGEDREEREHSECELTDEKGFEGS